MDSKYISICFVAMDFCQNVSVSGEYQQEQVLSPPCSKLGGLSTSLDDLFSAQNTVSLFFLWRFLRIVFLCTSLSLQSYGGALSNFFCVCLYFRSSTTYVFCSLCLLGFIFCIFCFYAVLLLILFWLSFTPII